jgi:hypothetical protein
VRMCWVIGSWRFAVVVFVGVGDCSSAGIVNPSTRVIVAG